MKKRMNQTLGSKIYLIESFSKTAFRSKGNISLTSVMLLDADIEPTISPTFTFTITPPPATIPPYEISIDPISVTVPINF
jgi:hypothetical protein